MKKIFLAVLAVAAMASCSKNEVTDVNDDNPNLIKFEPYAGQYTKASVKNIVELRDQGIKVYANIAGADFGTYISNLPLVYNAGAWNYTDDYYWINDDTDIEFYAYSTAQTLTAADRVIVPVIAATAATQEDILVATPVSQSSGTVSFVFNHVLTQLDFQILCSAGVGAIINSFEIQGVATESTGLSLETGNFETPTGAALEAAYTYGGGGFPLTIAPGVSYNLSAANATGAGTFMILPQVVTPWATAPDPVDPGYESDNIGARIKINYTLKFDDVTVLDNVDAYFPIPAIEWVKNKKYFYTLTFAKGNGGGYDEEGEPLLSDERIEFTVISVTDWTNNVPQYTPLGQ